MSDPESGGGATAPAVDLLGSRPQRRRLALWSVGLVVVLTIGVGAVFGARLGQDATLVDSPLIGTPAPARSLPLLEGPGSLSLADLRGQVVLVNFWASRCVPCRQEHPALLATSQAYQDAGVTVVAVSYQDQTGAATAFLDELGRGRPPGYRYLTDPGSAAALDFGVFGIPETFIIDRRGIIVGKITGAVTFPVLAGVLDEVLAGRQPQSRTVGPVQPGLPGEGSG